MWLLKGDSGNFIYLKPKTILTVGRNKGDIVLSDDGSISRVHAQITVEPLKDIGEIQDKNVPLSTLTIKDTKSKYGNFILKDDEEIPITEEGYSLQHMDRIRFGLQNYIFTVIYVPIITATSGMKDDEKKQLVEIIDAIDGKIIYAWTSMCTHMTVETPTISEKFSCALASCTPMVTIDYWKAVLTAFENNEEFPEPNDFVGAINNMMKNVGNVSVKPNPLRKSCFQNLTFVHFNSKQYTLYKRMIRLAGGTSIKYGKEKIDLNVCDENVIIVQLVESNTTQATGTGDANYAAACEELGRCKRRSIPECEIALAILNCSTEKYCNPKYDYAELFRNRNSQAPEDDSTIRAMDTQDIDLPTTSSRQQAMSHIVAETVEESDEFQFQAPKAIEKNAVDSISESVASSYNSDSVGSMKLASLNHEKYLEEEIKKGSTLSSIRNTRESHIVKETAEESRESDSHPSRINTKSESLSESSYNSESIGSMKLASLNHEKYLEEEFNKGPMTSSTQKPQTESDIVKETIDDNSQSDSQSFKTTSKKIASSSYDSPGSMKRDRDEDVASDTALKKVRLAEDRPRKQSLWDKLQASCTDWLTGDDDFSEEKVDVNTIPEMRETNRDTTNDPTVARKKEAEPDFDIADKWAVPIPKRKALSPRADGSESEEKTLLATGDDTSRKRKVGRSDVSPSHEVTENPRKRNKVSVNSEKEMPQSSRRKGLTEKTVALPKRMPRVESDEEVWQESKKYQSEDDLDSSSDTRKKYDYGEVSIYFQRPDDPNKSTQRLLRITCTDELDDESTVSGLRKCFRKRHTKIPSRIEFYDVSDDSTWSTRSYEDKDTSFADEDVATTHKISPTSVIKRKKTLRL